MECLGDDDRGLTFPHTRHESDEYGPVLGCNEYGNVTIDVRHLMADFATRKRIERWTVAKGAAMATATATASPEPKREIYHPICDPLEIRVLVLEPSSRDDSAPLRCSLRPVSLGLDSLTETKPDGSTIQRTPSHGVDVASGTAVWYTALSYQWGPPDFTCPVDVLAREDPYNSMSQPKPKVVRKFITPNLSAALHHLRHPSEKVFLWIDQLCIDQFDNEEKSAQVALMGKIYERALNTTVWLGEEPEGGVFEVLAAIRHGFQFTTDEVGDESIYERLILPCERAEAWRLLTRFFSRPWFSRAWVMQEVILSKKTTIRCGPGLKEDKSDACSLDWDSFGEQCLTGLESGYFTWLDRKEGGGGGQESQKPGTDRFQAAQVAADLSVRSSMYHSRTTTNFGSALVEARYAEATDLRDKVYAVLGPTSEQFDIDYTATAPEVFRRATAAVIAADLKAHNESATRSTLQVKYKAEWEKGSMKDPKGVEMDHFQTTRMLCSVDHEWMDGQPSWVPDWGKPRATVALGYDKGTKMLHHAGHGTLTEEKLIGLSPDEMVLTFAGKLVDRIGNVGHICLDPGGLYPNSGTNETLMDLVEFAKECAPTKSDSDDDGFDVIWKTLVAGMDKRGIQKCPPHYRAVFEKKLQQPEDTSSKSTWASSNKDQLHRSDSRPAEDENKADQLPPKKSKKKKKEKPTREKPVRRPAWERSVLEVQMAYGQAMRNRRLCVTEERRLLMLAPAMAQQGDVIAVFAGIGMPFVLRPEQGRRFRLVGHCYVHGLMQREVNGMGLETRIIELV